MKRRNWKRLLGFGSGVALVILLSGCADRGILVKSYGPDEMMHYADLGKVDSTGTLRNQVFYIEEGETIPLRIAMDTEFMDFRQNQVDIVAKQKLYFMIQMPDDISEQELTALKTMNADKLTEMSRAGQEEFMDNYQLYISRDATHWASLYEGKAYREVLGFQHGEISLGFMASGTEGLQANLKIKTVK